MDFQCSVVTFILWCAIVHSIQYIWCFVHSKLWKYPATCKGFWVFWVYSQDESREQFQCWVWCKYTCKYMGWTVHMLHVWLLRYRWGSCPPLAGWSHAKIIWLQMVLTCIFSISHVFILLELDLAVLIVSSESPHLCKGLPMPDRWGN